MYIRSFTISFFIYIQLNRDTHIVGLELNEYLPFHFQFGTLTTLIKFAYILDYYK